MGYIVSHDKAFSHRKVSIDIARVIGGNVFRWDQWMLPQILDKVIIVATIDYHDVRLMAPWVLGSSGALWYGVVEGVPILTRGMTSSLDQLKIVVPSEYSYERLSKVIHVDDIVPHGVDFESIRPRKCSLAKQIREEARGRKVICFIGSNDYRKGLDVFAKIARFMPKYFYVALTGSGLFDLNEISVSGIKVIDRVYRVDIGCFYSACDVVVVASRNEGYGLVLSEAAYSVGRVVSNGFPTCYEQMDFHYGIVCVEPKTMHTMEMNGQAMEFYEPNVEEMSYQIERVLNSDMPRLRREKIPGISVYNNLRW